MGTISTGVRGWALLWVVLGACSPSATSVAPNDPSTPDPDDPRTGPPVPSDERGAVWYGEMCAACHGAFGEGGSAPALDAWTETRATLVASIDDRMPLGNPERCRGECAERIADYVLEALQVPPPSCDEVVLPPRGLRLLTRREYAATLRDLLVDGAAPRTCGGLADCRYTSESCVTGRCVADPCGLHTFTFDAGNQRPTSVVVAGSFNGWASAPGAGAVVMSALDNTNVWLAKAQLGSGRHAYKLVLNGGDWRADPNNPRSEPDGFGGQNSIVQVDCASAPPAALDVEALVAAMPVESRSEGFAFDVDATAGIVTSVHVAEYMRAAERIAASLRSEDLAGCAASEPGCAARVARDFGRRLFRRPLAEEEASRYAALASSLGAPSDGMSVMLRVMFASPDFLYRSELGVEVGDGSFRLTDWEIASALSYRLWGTMPDEALFQAAQSGALTTPEGIEREARRLLADPKSREAVAAFAVQWLGIEGVRTAPKRESLHPGFTSEVREGLIQETARFVSEVALDGTGRFSDLYTAPHSFANRAVAELYGLSGATDASFVRVSRPEHRQAGLLGHGSVLAMYAHSDQSSPIKRGLFVRTRLLCKDFGVPPADAGGLPEVDPNATTRERFRQHSDKPSCHACHQYIDDVGFGFERFDAIGAFRETENGHAIDAAGDLNDVEGFGTGTRAPFSTLPELGAHLAASTRAKRCFATQYLRFATGRKERAEDRCALEALMKRFAESDWNIRELIVATTAQPGFAQRAGGTP